MAIVYEHIRIDTNEVFYIGWGINESRAYEYGRNDHWERVVKKADYRVNIFAKGLSKEDAIEVEIAEISRVGRYDLGKGPLVNKTDGGEGWQNLSKEIKDKIIQTKKINGTISKNNVKKAIDTKRRNGNLKHSEKTKENMKGPRPNAKKPKSESHKQNMRKPKSKDICPHCNRLIAKNNQFHFKNCKIVLHG